MTLIARVPAFSDPEYALKHQSQALPLYNGALWTDEHDCYWLNPYSNDVQGYLTSIALELAGLGFDEVLFDNFYFPDSDRISWTGSVTKQEAILDSALRKTPSTRCSAWRRMNIWSGRLQICCSRRTRFSASMIS